MAPPYVVNTLTANITSTEISTGNVPVNRGLGNLGFNAIYADFTTYQQLLVIGDTTIAIPMGKAFQVYVRNLDNALKITVKYTPTGLTQQVSPTIGPGEAFIIWQQNTNADPNAGITALVLNASGQPCIVEYFLGN